MPVDADVRARRSVSSGGAALVDEALALVRTTPALYLAGLPGALVLGSALAAFVLAHRGPWGPVGDGLLPGPTLVTALLVAFAYAVRSAAHGHVARRLATSRGRACASSPGWLAGAWAGLLVPALVTPGLLLLVPGALLTGRLAPLPGLILAEGRTTPQAVSACFARPRADAWRAAGAWGVLLLLAGVVLVNLLLASVLGVFALRMLTGADTTGLARLASPTNEGFLLGALVITAVAFDPLVALVRALVFIHMTSEETGDGLERRWASLLARRASSAALVVCAVGGLYALASPSRALAAERPPSRSLDAWVSNANEGAARLRALATGWEGAETIVLAPLEPVLIDALAGPVIVPPGRALPVDPGALLIGLPERIDSPDAVVATLEVADRIDQAAGEAVELTRSAPGDGSARSALRAELAERRYRLAAPDLGPASEQGPGLQARLAALWDRLFDDDPGPQASEASPESEPGRGNLGVILVAAAVVLALGGLLAVLVRAATLRPRRSSPARAVAPVLQAPAPEEARPDLLATADAEAARGDFRAAIGSLWAGVLRAQDAAGHLRDDPGRSNGEHLRSWSGDQDAAVRFRRAAVHADGLQFGPAAPDAGGWTSLRDECAPLLDEGPR